MSSSQAIRIEYRSKSLYVKSLTVIPSYSVATVTAETWVAIEYTDSVSVGARIDDLASSLPVPTDSKS